MTDPKEDGSLHSLSSAVKPCCDGCGAEGHVFEKCPYNRCLTAAEKKQLDQILDRHSNHRWAECDMNLLDDDIGDSFISLAVERERENAALREKLAKAEQALKLALEIIDGLPLGKMLVMRNQLRGVLRDTDATL